MSNVVINPKQLSSSDFSDDAIIVEDPSSLQNNNNSIQYHPLFSTEEADIILCSQDGVYFRVYSLVLKLSSGWFRSTFSLPQRPSLPSSLSSSSSSSSSPPIEPINVSESSEVLNAILSMASGYEIPRIHDFNYLESLVHAAEKYDMPGVLSILRFAILSPAFLKNHPIRVYAIACRWDWYEEAKIASKHTLAMDLLAVDRMDDIRKVDPRDLARLMLLHRRRRDQLKDRLDCKETFYANIMPGKCSHCHTPNPHEKWHRMKYDWVTKFEQCPIEDSAKDLLERLELADVLNATCGRCQQRMYSAEPTIRNLRQILDELPTEVEF
ncbi:hypothetical protein NLI96_g12337 [Meripilus lineatus]|uniref:BTB domain-containing protein n=1 Tax=Meripilus lineatus TaxID=2056292 RepID=A0AAD5Y7P1_9APHY|nr:hypothetical protein NLI96_g12337 [Physisporinus lineatus]